MRAKSTFSSLKNLKCEYKIPEEQIWYSLLSYDLISFTTTALILLFLAIPNLSVYRYGAVDSR